MKDYQPAFCEECGVSIGVMVDQHGDVVVACACPDGTHDLGDAPTEWVDARVGGRADGGPVDE